MHLGTYLQSCSRHRKSLVEHTLNTSIFFWIEKHGRKVMFTNSYHIYLFRSTPIIIFGGDLQGFIWELNISLHIYIYILYININTYNIKILEWRYVPDSLPLFLVDLMTTGPWPNRPKLRTPWPWRWIHLDRWGARFLWPQMVVPGAE